MAKIYIEDIKLSAIRNKLFGSLSDKKQVNIFDAIVLSSGDYLPIQKMIDGKFDVYGGGGTTAKKHNEFNVAVETFGIGRVGARCGCVFKIKPKSWVTDNALYANKIDESFDIEFLIHFLNFKNLNQYANTAAQPVISLKRISGITIPKIDLKLQNEIVAILNNIENGIIQIDNDKYGISQTLNFISSKEELTTELTRQQDLVKQLRQSFLREAMQGKILSESELAGLKDEQDYETGEQLLERIKTEKEKIAKAKNPANPKIKKILIPTIKEEEIPFDIPENWVWCRLGEIGELKRGKSKHRPRDDKQLFENGTYPFIQTGDVSKAKNNNDLITTVNNYYSEFGLKQSEIQKKGTLCITIAANIAECGFLNFDACVPDSIVCFSSIHKAIEKYTYYYLKIVKEELERFAPATAQKNINLGILNSFPIPLPPLPEQNRIVKKLEELMKLCDDLQASIQASKEQNEMLLQGALRDALRAKPKEYKVNKGFSIAAEE